MGKKEITIGEPIAIGSITLVPITKVSLNYECGNTGILFFGSKQPVAVIVISASAKTAFRINGEEVSIDHLIQEMPDLKATIEGI